jgi:hypothetical protein
MLSVVVVVACSRKENLFEPNWHISGEVEYSWNSDPEAAGSTKGNPVVRAGVEYHKVEDTNNVVVAILAKSRNIDLQECRSGVRLSK